MKLTISILALMFSSFIIQAEDDLMKKLDANNDGKISKAEAQSDSVFSALFADLDTDQDGFITALELKQNLHKKLVKKDA